jgi:rhodanese-related sulfurtransferase
LDIDVEKFLRMKRQAVAFILFDLRDEASFGEGHIQGAFNVPLKRFLKEVKKSVPQKTTPIVIYDEGSDALPKIIKKAESDGFINIVYIEGGYPAYLLAHSHK